MPKKKTIPPPDDFSSEFMETEFVKELSEQQVVTGLVTSQSLISTLEQRKSLPHFLMQHTAVE